MPEFWFYAMVSAVIAAIRILFAYALVGDLFWET